MPPGHNPKEPTHIVGDRGVLQIPEYSWAPSEMVLPDGGVVRETLPECGPTNFARSVGLRFDKHLKINFCGFGF